MVYYAFTFLTLKNHLLTTTCDGWYYTNFFSICLVLWFQGCPLLGFIFAIEDIYSLNSELTFLFLRRNLSGFFNCILSYFISLYAWINVQCLYWRFYIYYRKNILVLSPIRSFSLFQYEWGLTTFEDFFQWLDFIDSNNSIITLTW